MSDAAIAVERIGKLYRIGAVVDRHATLRDALARAATRPLRALSSRLRGQRPATSTDLDLWALREVGFDVGHGEVLGVVGSNGAGKTTLLKILSRITLPTEGRVEIRGRVASLLEVGTGFHPELTGRENILLNGAILGMRREEVLRKLDEIVAFAEISAFTETPVKRYSSGMYVRLAFAVAAHLEPEILLVDEVLAVGDHAFQKKCLGRMSEIGRSGRTVLFVSHNLQAVRSLCTKAILLESGRLTFHGTADECVDLYLKNQTRLQDSEVETSTADRRDGCGEEFRFLKVRLCSTIGRAAIAVGGALEAELEFSVDSALLDTVLGFGVESADGVRIVECRSNDSYAPIPLLEAGRYRVRCSLTTNPLAPGRYMLSVGARCGKKELDYLPNLLMFEVRPVERSDSLWFEELSGYVRIRSQWTKPERMPDSSID